MKIILYLKKPLCGLMLTVISGLFQTAQAQQKTEKVDKIYKNDTTILSVKVVTTNGATIQYKSYFVSKNTTVFNIPKTEVDKIVFRDGRMEYYGGQALEYRSRAEYQNADLILQKDSTNLSVKVIDTKGDSIRYKAYFKGASKQIFTMSKKNVQKIEYKNGSIDYFTEAAMASVRQLNQERENKAQALKQKLDSLNTLLNKKKNIIKVSPLTNIVGYTTFAYERSLFERQSVEVKLGIIGMGQINEKDIPQEGYFGSLGYKFFLTPSNLSNKSTKPRHILHGMYFRPEIAIGRYQHLYTHETYIGGKAKPEIRQEAHKVTYNCLVFNMGKQWVTNPLVLDFFIGLGLGNYTQTEASVGIIDRTRYAYRMDISGAKGSANVKFKLGMYIGFLW